MFAKHCVPARVLGSGPTSSAMKKHIITKELQEGLCKTICNITIMRYEGIKKQYLPEKSNQITCGRCKNNGK